MTNVVSKGTYRTEVADDIIGYLKAGTSVHLVGLRSSGRSGMLRHIADRLTEQGIGIAHVRGIKALRDRPLGALAVSGIKVNPAPHQLQAMSTAVSALESLLAPSSSVLIVDDTDDLDTTSLGAIIAVQTGLQMPVLCSSRPTNRHDDNMAMITSAIQPTIQVTSDPLDFDEVHQLVHALFGGSVSPSTVAHIATITGGLPGLVRAVVDAARRNNMIVHRDGVWSIRGDLWTPALTSAVEPLLSDLDDSAIGTLTAIAMEGAMPLERAGRITPPQTLAELDEAGLLHIIPVCDQNVVGVFPPLVAEYLTRGRSAAHQMIAAERLIACPEQPRIDTPHDNQRPLGMPGGEPILSYWRARHWSATMEEQQLRWETDPNPANAAALLETYLATCARRYEFEHVITHTRTDGAEPCAMADFLAVVTLCGRLFHAPHLVQRFDNVPGMTPFDGLFRAINHHMDLFASPHKPDVPDTANTCDQHQSSRDALRVAKAQSLVIRGQGRAALELLDGFTTGSPRFSQIAEVSRELALLEECRLDEAVRRARIHIDRACRDNNTGAIQAHAYVAALALTLQGKLVDIVSLTSSALALAPTPMDQKYFQTGLLTLGAHAAILEGRIDFAHSLARQAEGLGYRDGPLPGMNPGLVGAAIEVGENAEAAAVLWQATENRLEAGFLPAAMVSGVSSIERYPDTTRAQVLVEAASTSGSPLFALMADYAQTISSRDPDLLAALIPRLSDAGLRVYAVHSSVAQAIGLRRAGKRSEAAALTHSVWTETGLRGRDLCGLYTSYDREVNLSARERQIAVHVGRGRSSVEIATEMVLSVRTVENHIFNACHKIGIDNREELAWAACSWLTCTPR